ncbi:MAG: thioredoxin family protein [Myxococcaceae bacterium]|nr:thioredoxin family protein [Myxococcaceae bacterium]
MGASTIELTEANFEAEVKKNGILFIDFWASWCPPCRAFAPVFEAAAQKHPDIVFGKVNTEEQPGLGQAFEVQAIPTLAVFREGVLLFSEAGAIPAKALEQLVTKVKELDMNQVRADIEDIKKREGAKGEPK